MGAVTPLRQTHQSALLSSGVGRTDVGLHSRSGDEEGGTASLHPGGLALTREMAEAAGIGPDQRVLDVASGTGASAAMVADRFGVDVVGLEPSPRALDVVRAVEAPEARVDWVQGDAHRLPFPSGTFDGAYCECTLMFLDRPRTLAQMVDVVRPGGWVAMHDLCVPSRGDAGVPDHDTLDTLAGWEALFQECGLEDVRAVDKTDVLRGWSRESLREVGFYGIVELMGRAWTVGGPEALWRVVRTTSLLESERLAYGMVVGRKPAA